MIISEFEDEMKLPKTTGLIEEKFKDEIEIMEKV